MADIRERVLVELENIEGVLKQMPGLEALSTLSPLELAGVAALLQSFYNGVENVLKQVVVERGLTFEKGASWHRALLDLACSAGVIQASTRDRLDGYLAFRHYFVHGYAFNLRHARVRPLVEGLSPVYSTFRKEVRSAVGIPDDEAT